MKIYCVMRFSFLNIVIHIEIHYEQNYVVRSIYYRIYIGQVTSVFYATKHIHMIMWTKLLKCMELRFLMAENWILI